MIFLGVDPGTRATGYGVVDARGNTVSWLASGVITPPPKAALPGKLLHIYDSLITIIHQHSAECMSVEKAFYAKNANTALVLGHARGVILLAGKKCNIRLYEFAPREIKKAVVGNGNASKEQVCFMVETLLKPKGPRQQLDAYDALGAALCGIFTVR